MYFISEGDMVVMLLVRLRFDLMNERNDEGRKERRKDGCLIIFYFCVLCFDGDDRVCIVYRVVFVTVYRNDQNYTTYCITESTTVVYIAGYNVFSTRLLHATHFLSWVCVYSQRENEKMNCSFV
jgi:hypothetical protein